MVYNSLPMLSGSVAIWVQNRQDFPKGSAHTWDRQINSGCPVKFDSDIDNKQFFSLRPKPCIHCLSETLAFSLLNLSALNVHQCNDRWIIRVCFPAPGWRTAGSTLAQAFPLALLQAKTNPARPSSASATAMPPSAFPRPLTTRSTRT